MVSLIVATDSKWGMNIKWQSKIDMQHFKNKTMGHAVIMGKNTWKSLPDKCRGLQGRLNIVVSSTMTQLEFSNDDNTCAGKILVKTLHDALKVCDGKTDIFIIGGCMLYEEAIKMKIVNKFYITRFFKDYECDLFFPHRAFLNYISLEETNHEILYEDPEMSIIQYNVSNQNIITNAEECQYLDLIMRILSEDHKGRITRNALTYSIFGSQIEFNMSNGFPLLTTKKMFFRGIVEELLFFIKGQTNSNILSDRKVRIWEKNTDREFLDSVGLTHYEVGDMGPMYGFVWRHYNSKYEGMNKNYDNVGFDQLKNVINLIKTDPHSRRIVMTTFEPDKLDQCVLAPCHGLTVQFYVRGKYLDCKMYQRSCDVFLGLPYNIASYALMLHLIAGVTNYRAGKLIITLGDTHIYKSHLEQVKEQIKREPYAFPKLNIKKKINAFTTSLDDTLEYLEDLEYTDFELDGYQSWSGIKADMVA
jgi:dihydrofolate reductase/thymidylate synthase